MPALLDPPEIAARLDALGHWSLDGAEIRRTFAFTDFAAAIGFVNAVARLAEAANHHPDIDIRWNKVTLRLSTHSKGGLTDADFNLAGQINAL